jgi:hypothetical protein
MASIFFLWLQTILQTEILTYLTLAAEMFFLFQLTDKHNQIPITFNLNNISKLKYGSSETVSTQIAVQTSCKS